MKILVTGGAGFIGSNLVDGLIQEGHSVVVVDDLSTGRQENVHKQAKLVKLNIANKKLAKVFAKEKPEVVFHLSAQIDIGLSVKDPIWDAEQNIIGSIQVLKNCKEYGVKKIIFSSTAGVYGDTPNVPTKEDNLLAPPSPYGIAKLTVEKYLEFYFQIYHLPYVVLRYANVYGPRQLAKGEGGVVAIFVNQALKGQSPVIYGDGQQTRDFVFVGDIVEANLKALKSDRAGVYNIGTGVETSIARLAEVINNQLETKVEFGQGPSRPVDQKRSALDSSLAKTELYWQANTSLEQGVAQTLNWFRKK